MSNDPAWLFCLTALDMGFTKAPLLTKAELAKVADKAGTFVILLELHFRGGPDSGRPESASAPRPVFA